MRRRHFITLIGGAAAWWPLAARAQQSTRMRRVGALMPFAANDPQAQERNAAFLQGLQQLGWTVGQNIQIDYRWSGGTEDATQKDATELVSLAPDVIFASGSAAAGPLRRTTRTVPIVFTNVIDPVGSGFAESLPRPGGKSPVNMGNAGEIERSLAAFARSPNGGLIMTGSGLAVVHRDLTLALASRHWLPAVYYDRYFAVAGGLISYGPNIVDEFRRAAGYVDRILRGEKPADLPVQVATKHDLVINLKTAKALGISVPPTLLARADEVTE